MLPGDCLAEHQGAKRHKSSLKIIIIVSSLRRLSSHQTVDDQAQPL
jgi:hypothetical protein